MLSSKSFERDLFKWNLLGNPFISIEMDSRMIYVRILKP